MGVQNTVNTPTKNNTSKDVAKEVGSTILDGAGDAATSILLKRSVYGTLKSTREITVRTPLININTTVKVVKAVKIAAKAVAIINGVVTVIEVGSEFAAGRYKAGGAKIAVAAIQAACIFIPGPGWIVAGAIGIIDAIWGDDFYNWLEE